MSNKKSRKSRILKLIDEALLLGRVEYLRADEAAKIRGGLIRKVDRILDELFNARQGKKGPALAHTYEAIARIAAMQDKIIMHGQSEEAQRELEAVKRLLEQQRVERDSTAAPQGET